VAALLAALPTGAELVAVRQQGENALPDPHLRLFAGDGVLLFGTPSALEQARAMLGSADPGRISKDRGTMDLVRVFVSRAAVVGHPIGELSFPDGIQAKITEVRRGDALILPDDRMVLEFGDRVGVIAAREALPTLRQYFGDSIKSTTAFSYASVGLGMSLGVLLGLVQVPIPGIGAFSLGIAGGPLLVALILGRFGRIGPLSWHIPLPANVTLRDFGLMLFLAAVGLASGTPFVETVADTGITFLAVGAAVLLATMLGILLLGHLVFRLSTDDLLGVMSGAAGNPAILSYANQSLPSDRIDVAYATIFPSMTILKILCVQIAIGLLGG
jgi:putative transport protein